MQTCITYGSQYGSAAHYAKEFSRQTGFPVLPCKEVKDLTACARVIHFGALYAGGVLGLKHIVSLLPAQAACIIVTVGLADVADPENIQHIRNAIRRQLPEDVFRRVQIFHLRGAIDYSRLNLKHRTMMALLCAKVRRLPEEKQNAETRAMLQTYGKQVSFVNDGALIRLKNSLTGRGQL